MHLPLPLGHMSEPGSGSALSWLFHFDPSIAADAVLADEYALTAADGLLDGAGTIDIGAEFVSGYLDLESVTVGVYGQCIADRTGYAPSMGLTFVGRFVSRGSAGSMGMHFQTIGQTFNEALCCLPAGGGGTSSIAYKNGNNAGGNGCLLMRAATNWDFVEIQMALVLGGFDATYQPAGASDDSSSYPRGQFVFLKNPDSPTNWILAYVDASNFFATLYPYAHTSYYAAGRVFKVFEMGIPDVDNSALIAPLACDRFTDTNGTALGSHTMNTGAGWTVTVGTITVQSNALSFDAIGGEPKAAAYVDTGESDVVIHATAADGGVGWDHGVMVRYADANNLWCVTLNATTVYLYERNAGTWTARASAAHTASGTEEIVVVADGAEINAWCKATANCRYTSATLNQTSTKHGVRSGSAGPTMDNWACWARGNGGEYSVLDGYMS